MDRYDQILAEYRTFYDVDTLSSANDKANLSMLIRNQILVERIQEELNGIIEDNDTELIESIVIIKKLQDSLKDLTESSLALERALGIDRKSRKKDSQESVADYISSLKVAAREWLETQTVKVFCPKCQVLVARLIPVHEYTEFNLSVQCSQCNKAVTAKRSERDIFFDIKERNKSWRTKYPVEIVLPSAKAESYDDDIILDPEGEEGTEEGRESAA